MRTWHHNALLCVGDAATRSRWWRQPGRLGHYRRTLWLVVDLVPPQGIQDPRYVYRPGQRSQWGDHLFPDGLVMPNTSQLEDWGPGFVSRPNVVPEVGRWYAYEVMLKANTPGQKDGRVTCWLDGEVVAEFPNLRLRDVDTLKIDHFSIGLHAGANPNGPTKKWYDNLVAATEYVGPMAP